MIAGLNFLLIISLLNFITPIFLVLDPYEKRCIFKEVAYKQILSGVYYVSGEEEDKNEVQIYSPKNTILFQKQNMKNGSFSINTEDNGQYAMCFKSSTSLSLTVSFDFHDESKEDQLISVSN
jgi:hypothetical protein